MPIIGADLSFYDPNGAADDYPFVILNVEDRNLHDKASIAHAAGVTIMLYSWVYPGDNGYSVTRSYAAEELFRLDGIIVRHHWLDYEQAGVAPRDLQAAGARVSPAYAPVGTYTYLATLGQVRPVQVGPLWLAYYPEGYNVVPYNPGMSQRARNEGAVIHQWTSVAPPDGRDLDTVLDEAWYASVVGGTYIPSQPDQGPSSHKGVDMLYKTTDAGKPTFYRDSGGVLVALADAAPWYTAVVSGQVPVIDLGGPLGAVAFNIQSEKARRALAALTL